MTPAKRSHYRNSQRYFMTLKVQRIHKMLDIDPDIKRCMTVRQGIEKMLALFCKL